MNAARADADAIDAALRRADPGAGLVALLDERSPRLAGRVTADAERLRGLALAALSDVELPAAAVPFVLEELESGRNPSNVAAAARALRGGGPHLPAEAPALLVGAIERLRASDDTVRFPTGRDALPTALADLAETLTILGPAAASAGPGLGRLLAAHGGELSRDVSDRMHVALETIGAAPGQDAPSPCCCGGSTAAATAPLSSGDAALVRPLVLEDQDGSRRSFEARFAGRPTVVAFFYTRCENPERCSLTVTRLAGLDRRLRAARIHANVAGISYDPGYDRPARLRTYGEDRGMAFSSRCSLLRTVDRFDPFVEAFGLGVGYGPVTVNQHSIDVVLLDSDLAVTGRLSRRLWMEDDVIDALTWRPSVAPAARDAAPTTR